MEASRPKPEPEPEPEPEPVDTTRADDALDGCTLFASRGPPRVFTLDRLLREGAQGRLFEARVEGCSGKVAVKQLRPSTSKYHEYDAYYMLERTRAYETCPYILRVCHPPLDIFTNMRVSPHMDVELHKHKYIYRLPARHDDGGDDASEHQTRETVSTSFIVDQAQTTVVETLADVLERESSESLWLPLEWCPQDLWDRLASEPLRRFPRNTVQTCMYEVVHALYHAHERHMTHGDIKPENILVSRDGHVRVSDWGSALCFARNDNGGDDVRVWTTTVAPRGTMPYVSPDAVLQYTQAHANPRGNTGLSSVPWCPFANDVWAYGVSVFILLSGVYPWKTASVVDTSFRYFLFETYQWETYKTMYWRGVSAALPASLAAELYGSMVAVVEGDRDCASLSSWLRPRSATSSRDDDDTADTVTVTDADRSSTPLRSARLDRYAAAFSRWWPACIDIRSRLFLLELLQVQPSRRASARYLFWHTWLYTNPHIPAFETAFVFSPSLSHGPVVQYRGAGTGFPPGGLPCWAVQKTSPPGSRFAHHNYVLRSWARHPHYNNDNNNKSLRRPKTWGAYVRGTHDEDRFDPARTIDTLGVQEGCLVPFVQQTNTMSHIVKGPLRRRLRMYKTGHWVRGATPPMIVPGRRRLHSYP